MYRSTLLDLLAADSRIPLTRNDLNALLADPKDFIGRAVEQINEVITHARSIQELYPTASTQPAELRL